MNTHRLLVPALLGLAALRIGFGPISAPAIDLDGDGMSDVWQAHHGVTALDRNLDWDMDGAVNLVESLFRTDPRLNGAPDETLDMFGVSRLSVTGNIPSVRWPTQDGARYLVEQSTDMIAWSPAASPVEGDGLMANVPLDPNPLTFGFFRVIALDPRDLDGDRLDLWEERFLGYDPNNPSLDIDGDGVHDDWETYLFSNLTTATAISDADADGVADVEEFQRNLNPWDVDTDNDGYSDAQEIESGTDPAAFDHTHEEPGPTRLEVFSPLPPTVATP